jgi:hypothetical protein
MGAPGYRVIFALLVQPDLLLAPVRTLAAAAEVAPATAANALALLRQEGLVHETGVGRRLTAPQQLLERWLRGYETVVRPKLLLGQFQTPDPDPEAVERRIASSLSSEDEPWAYGGTAGANRLTGYYRGEETVIHLGAYSKETLRRLRAVRSKDGSLVMLQVPSNLAFTSPADRAVAPLLIYSELLHNGDRRSLETAAEVMERYLGDLSA